MAKYIDLLEAKLKADGTPYKFVDEFGGDEGIKDWTPDEFAKKAGLEECEDIAPGFKPEVIDVQYGNGEGTVTFRDTHSDYTDTIDIEEGRKELDWTWHDNMHFFNMDSIDGWRGKYLHEDNGVIDAVNNMVKSLDPENWAAGKKTESVRRVAALREYKRRKEGAVCECCGQELDENGKCQYCAKIERGRRMRAGKPRKIHEAQSNNAEDYKTLSGQDNLRIRAFIGVPASSRGPQKLSWKELSTFIEMAEDKAFGLSALKRDKRDLEDQLEVGTAVGSGMNLDDIDFDFSVFDNDDQDAEAFAKKGNRNAKLTNNRKIDVKALQKKLKAINAEISTMESKLGDLSGLLDRAYNERRMRPEYASGKRGSMDITDTGVFDKTKALAYAKYINALDHLAPRMVASKLMAHDEDRGTIHFYGASQISFGTLQMIVEWNCNQGGEDLDWDWRELEGMFSELNWAVMLLQGVDPAVNGNRLLANLASNICELYSPLFFPKAVESLRRDGSAKELEMSVQDQVGTEVERFKAEWATMRNRIIQRLKDNLPEAYQNNFIAGIKGENANG